jgi:glycosyltransferase involved in cell wall biosynthesis
MIIYHWTPLPPARNGIADYADRLNTAFGRQVGLACVNPNPFSKVPVGTQVIDPAQAWRDTPKHAVPLYQIGCNGDHIDIYHAALKHPGVVVLHDMRLFYLHELMNLAPTHFQALMLDSNPIMAGIRSDAILRKRQKIPVDYTCFDMTGDLLRRARIVLVHSHYARNLLLRHHGMAFADRIAVMPHFAIEPTVNTDKNTRAKLGVPDGALLVVTSGFATGHKRFDWVAQVLSTLVTRGHNIFWVHAGSERPAEFNLSGLMANKPQLAGRTRVTGYINEADLDAWLSVADIVLNLRFPSVGESSGTLARAMALGRCCVVTRTGAYDELPDTVVAKSSAFDAVASLERTLEGLLNLPRARAAFGRNAQNYCESHLSVTAYARGVIDLCYAAQSLEPLGDAILAQDVARDQTVLRNIDPAELSPGTIHQALPATLLPTQIAFHRDGARRIRIEAAGIDVAAGMSSQESMS